MRIYISRFGESIDLDESSTYDYLPTDTNQLRTIMLKEIGYFYCYTHYWHEDIFSSDQSGQMERCHDRIKFFTKNERENYENVRWYQEQIFLFQEEIENMC